MKLTFDKPERHIVSGANWPVLEYLVERFNRAGLEGVVALRRSMMLRNLQLCLSADCCGVHISALSTSFEDELITDAAHKERLVHLVSAFLLKVKRLHEKNCRPATPSSHTDEHSVA